MNTSRHLAALAIAATLSVAACSSGSDSEGAPDTSAAPTQVETIPAIAETDPSTTTSTTTSTAPASTSATTASAVTATSESLETTTPSDVEAEIEAAAIESREAYLYAVYNVDAPDALDRLLTSTTDGGASQERGLELYNNVVENGWRARPNPEVPNSTTIEQVSIIDDTTAEVTSCTVDAGVVFSPGANPDGSDQIVNDDIVAYRNLLEIVFVEGVWLVDMGVRVDTWEGATECDPT